MSYIPTPVPSPRHVMALKCRYNQESQVCLLDPYLNFKKYTYKYITIWMLARRIYKNTYGVTDKQMFRQTEDQNNICPDLSSRRHKIH